jgi:hypothetical protein
VDSQTSSAGKLNTLVADAAELSTELSTAHSMRARVFPPAARAAMQAPAGRPRAQPPSHFVGLRLTTPAVSDVYARVHSALLDFDAALAPTLVPAVRVLA